MIFNDFSVFSNETCLIGSQNYRESSACNSDKDVDEGDEVTHNDDDDSDEGDGDVDWLSVLLLLLLLPLWYCEPFDVCVPVGTLLIRVKNFAIGLCLDLLLLLLLFIDEVTVLAPDVDIAIGIFSFCTGKLISSAVLFGGARI